MRPQRFHYPIVHGKNKIWGCLYLYSIDLLLDLSNIRRIGKPTTRIYMPPSTLDTHNTQTVCVCRIASFFRYNIRTSHRPSLFSLARIFPFWVSRACINKTSVFPMVQPQSGSRSADHFRYNSQPVKPSHTTQKKKEKSTEWTKRKPDSPKREGGETLYFSKRRTAATAAGPLAQFDGRYISSLLFLLFLLILSFSFSSFRTRLVIVANKNNKRTRDLFLCTTNRHAPCVCIASAGAPAAQQLRRTLSHFHQQWSPLHHLQSSLTWYRAVANEIN